MPCGRARDGHPRLGRRARDQCSRARRGRVQLLAAWPLTYGRKSVAWGCVGILRACLRSAVHHAKRHEQFGVAIVQHQLVASHIADLYVWEQTATRACEHASRCWDEHPSDVVTATVLAKHVAARHAAAGAATAVQVLASAR